MEAIQRTEHAETMVDSLRSGFWLFVELITACEESRLIHLQQRLWRVMQSPTGEMQQVIAVNTQRTQRELANALRIQKVINPADFLPLLVDQAIRGNAGGSGRPMGQRELHKGC